LYVQSVKTLVGIDRKEEWGIVLSPQTNVPGFSPGPDVKPDYKTYSEPAYENILPDDQKETVETVKRIAKKYGFEVQVIDISNKNILRKFLDKRKLKLETFPTLITENGERLEGNITEDQVELLLRKPA